MSEPSPVEIAEILGGEHTAGSLAAALAAYWPTVQAALRAYDGPPVAPIPSGD